MRKSSIAKGEITSRPRIVVGAASPAMHSWRSHGVGDACLVRGEEGNGTVLTGFWRTSPVSDGCNPDGSCLAAGVAQLNDAVLVIEGSGTVTIAATGTKVQVEPGTIISHPQGIETRWEIDGPYLKKFFVEWDGSPESTTIQDIAVGHAAAEPDDWRACEWSEPGKGPQTYGEVHVIREDVAPHKAVVGIWRASSADRTPVFYSGQQGDTNLLALEGQGRIVDEESGEQYEVKRGDVISLAAGNPVSWTALSPFAKLFFVVSQAKG